MPYRRTPEAVQDFVERLARICKNNEISISSLHKAIAIRFGSSRWTIKEYMRVLREWGFIEPLGAGSFKLNPRGRKLPNLKERKGR